MDAHSLVLGLRGGEALVMELGGRRLLFALLCRNKTRQSSVRTRDYADNAFVKLKMEAGRRYPEPQSEERLSFFYDALNRL